MKQPQDKSGEFYAAQFDRVKSVGAPKKERDRNIPELLSLLCASDTFSLLDIGCGLGKVARCAKDLFPNASVHGVDISPDIIEKAKTFRPDIDYRISGEIELPFADNSFEHATCRMSIHHYPKMAEHLQEVCRVLKTGGVYLIMDIVPEEGEQDECLNDVFLSAEREAPGDGHIKFYTLQEYESFFADSGLAVEEVVYSPFAVTWPKTTDYYKSILRSFERMPTSFRRAILFEDCGETFNYTMRMGNIFAKNLT